MSEIVWRPDEATLEHANVTRLMRRAAVRDYRELVENPESLEEIARAV